MRFLVFLILALTSINSFAQGERLPERLVPNGMVTAEAARMGAKVIKLLPAESMYKSSANESQNDRDFPLGIRGSGAFFSFSNESHSFNRFPEISLRSRRLVSGPATTLILLRDLGRTDLSYVDESSAEFSSILNYKYPKYLKDIPAERERLYGEAPAGFGGGFLNLEYQIGTTYLYRAITLEKSDIIVAFQVVSVDMDGSMTLMWKELKKLPVPIALYMSDEELQKQIEAVITAEKIICDAVTVKENRLYFIKDSAKAIPPDGNKRLETALAKHQINFFGVGVPQL